MLNISDEIRDFMEERHFSESDLEEVIAWGNEGNCLVEEDGTKLAKKRLENCTLYVEYTADGEVVDAYSHRVMLVEDEEA